MARFDYFVVFAEMRTGSNYLEANINLFAGLQCHGEAFNPSFIGYPQYDDLLGVTLAQREEDPAVLIEAIKKNEGLNGFRFFNDHDPRALDICLNDPACAKIILTRNPVDSFVSWKIAQATGQWKLTNATHAKSEPITFDEVEFESYLGAIHAFQTRLLHTLQKSGQTAFYLAYEDLRDVEIMNGMATFLGIDEPLVSLDRKLKKQNPDTLPDKVTNFENMASALARLDRFNLTRTPNFEPRRGPMIPLYVAAPRSGLLYLPTRSGPDAAVQTWLAALDGLTTDDLQVRFTHQTLRQWKRSHAGHRSFTVLRHPIARAHTAFCERILYDGPLCFPQIRATLQKVHKLPIPAHPFKQPHDESYDTVAHRKAFLAFLGFLKNNLSAQTSVRVDPAWASQLTLLQGIAQFGPPDYILREDRLAQDLRMLGAQVGMSTVPAVEPVTDHYAGLLGSIYDKRVEAAGRDAYQRDYDLFGFEDWA